MAGKSFAKLRGDTVAERNNEHTCDASEERSTLYTDWSEDGGHPADFKSDGTADNAEVNRDDCCVIVEEDKDPIRENIIDVPMVDNRANRSVSNDMDVVEGLNEGQEEGWEPGRKCVSMNEGLIEQRTSTCSAGKVAIQMEVDNNMCTEVEKVKKSKVGMVLEKFVFVGIVMCTCGVVVLLS